MSLLDHFTRRRSGRAAPTSPSDHGRELAALANAARAEQARSHRSKVRAMCREICAASGQPIPPVLEN